MPKPTSRLSYLGYNTLLTVASPAVAAYAVFRDVRRIGVGALPNRFGRMNLTRPGTHPCVWLHAASVGETIAATPILHELQAICPDVRLVISNITPTGHETAIRMLPDADHIYFPYDIPMAVRRALKVIQPDVCVTIETELWPNFIYLSRKAGARVAVVNGRISDRSFRRASGGIIHPVFRWMLGGLNSCCMQTDRDAQRIIDLGADSDIVQVMGNSKFDQAVVADPTAGEVAAEMGFPEDAPTIVAGSTHAGEDEMVLDAFLAIRNDMPEARLILAPRRLERAPDLKQLLAARGLTGSFRSETPQASSGTEVLVLDTIGELRRVYSLARVAFVGGSLVSVGGHDLLQPLAKGKPVLFGPFTHNQREIAEAVLNCGAGQRIETPEDLARVSLDIMADPVRHETMARAGLRLLDENQGASSRYARHILELVENKA